jgi:hypothetical protein
MNYILSLEYTSFHLEKRFWLSPITYIFDMADYKYGYIFAIPGFKLLKFKVSKIMEAPHYVKVMSIFGREFILR